VARKGMAQDGKIKNLARSDTFDLCCFARGVVLANRACFSR
jgi:hypothetical protein